jgi:hypothetical protein
MLEGSAGGGQKNEVSTGSSCHPIPPLLCDSNIADISHPHIALAEYCAGRAI